MKAWLQTHIDFRFLLLGIALTIVVLTVGYWTDRRGCERSVQTRQFQHRVADRLGVERPPPVPDCSTIPPGR